MAKTKISKLAKELNVSLGTVFEFLQKNNITIEENPNTRVEDNVVELLNNEFNKDREIKKITEQKITEQKTTERAAVKEAPAATEPAEAKVPSDTLQKPKQVGFIKLDKNGNPIKEAPKAEEKKPVEAPKPEAPKAEGPKAAEAP